MELLELLQKLKWTGALSLDNPDEIVFESPWDIRVVFDRETFDFERVELQRHSFDYFKTIWDFSHDDAQVLKCLKISLLSQVMCTTDVWTRHLAKNFLKIMT